MSRNRFHRMTRCFTKLFVQEDGEMAETGKGLQKADVFRILNVHLT